MVSIKTKISYVIPFVILAFLSSCCDNYDRYNDGQYKSFHRMINDCKGLTRVVGISKMDGSMDHCEISIVVVDSANTYYECRTGGKLGLQIGDTVKVN